MDDATDTPFGSHYLQAAGSDGSLSKMPPFLVMMANEQSSDVMFTWDKKRDSFVLMKI